MDSITKSFTLKKIGELVKVELDQIKDRVDPLLLDQIKRNPHGKIVEYKMTDGQGIGFVVELDSGNRSWFFSEELQESGYEKSISMQISRNQISNSYHGSYQKNKVIDLVNPIHFFKWLTYSLKDVF